MVPRPGLLSLSTLSAFCRPHLLTPEDPYPVPPPDLPCAPRATPGAPKGAPMARCPPVPQQPGSSDDLFHRRDPRPPAALPASGAFPARTPGSTPCVWAQSPAQRAVSAVARGAAPARGTFGKAATSWRGRVWAPHIPGLLGPRGARAAGWSCWGLGLQAGQWGQTPFPAPPPPSGLLCPLWSGPGLDICACRVRGGHPDRQREAKASPDCQAPQGPSLEQRPRRRGS